MKNSALVVIDLQNDITKHYREIIDPVNAAIDWAVQKELWVIYIQHNNLSAGTRTFKPGTRGARRFYSGAWDFRVLHCRSRRGFCILPL